MTGFTDLDEFFEDTLPLPVGGKTYVIAAPDAETGLFVQRIFADGGRLHDAEEEALHRRTLGPVYQQLIDDGVSLRKLKHVAETALIWCVFGVTVAQEYWHNGGRPEAARPANRATRRATKSASTVPAKPTRSPASTTTTTTSPTTSGTGTPATRSRGRKS